MHKEDTHQPIHPLLLYSDQPDNTVNKYLRRKDFMPMADVRWSSGKTDRQAWHHHSLRCDWFVNARREFCLPLGLGFRFFAKNENLFAVIQQTAFVFGDYDVTLVF